MTIQLVAIDLDGTLLNSSKKISDASVAVIEAAQAAGVHIVLASARPPRSMMPFYKRLELDTAMINYNGALVRHPRTGQTLLHRPLSSKLAHEIAHVARRMFPDVLVSAEILDKWYTDRVEMNWLTETGKVFRPNVVAPLHQWMCQPLTKLLLLGEDEWLREIRDTINEMFGNQISVFHTDHNLLQIMNPSAGKSRALKTLAAHMNIERQRVMAIGDNANDVGMLKWAGIGVAMANASSLALKAADIVTAHNDADGAAKAIQKLILDGLSPWRQ